MKSFGEILEFTTEIFEDNGCTNKSLGVCKNSMEIFTHDEDEGKVSRKIEDLTIEWVYFVGEAKEDAVGIGCTFEKGKLVDYDGVFSLPGQAIKVLRKNGFRVPREFES